MNPRTIDRLDTGRPEGRPLSDRYGRTVTYLRLSVTDRCDFRCRYCMAEDMTFLPKKDVLSLEELERLAGAFIGRGVRKIRLTGGEPLVRRNIERLIEALGAHVVNGALEELTLTTNGSQLPRFAPMLAAAGVRRINVSVDSLDRGRFAAITRRGKLDDVLAGIEAATAAGLKVKINMVALKGLNDDEIVEMLLWAHGEGHELTLIETMPLGEVDEDRTDRFLPLTEVRQALDRRFTLTPDDHRTGGPARYWRVGETGGRIGFISPLTQNFCEGCNRVRVTTTGQLYLCLGQDDMVDLRAALRAEDSAAAIDAALDRAMAIKPLGHDFHIDRRGQSPAVARHMSVTGG